MTTSVPDIRIAQPEQKKVVPAFTVKKLDGSFEEPIYGLSKDHKRTVKVVKRDAGYLVTFSKGHSIRVATDAELIRMGFDKTIPMVQPGADTDAVGHMPNYINVESKGATA